MLLFLILSDMGGVQQDGEAMCFDFNLMMI